MNSQVQAVIDQQFSKLLKNGAIYQASLLVDLNNKSYSQTLGSKIIDSTIVTASISKLFTTASVLRLVEEEKIQLNERISTYLETSLLKNLHRYKDTDYSKEITVDHLITQTSGLADIFAESKRNLTQLALKSDRYFSVFEQLQENSKLKPHFKPGTEKAYYSDINFILLGLIIESVSGKSLDQVFDEYICQPLGLKKTFLTTEATYDLVPAIYNGKQEHLVPKFLHSNGAAGGVISTTRELMVFLKAFYSGDLFSNQLLNEESERMQLEKTPIRYARVMMVIPLDGLSTLFRGSGKLMGHSGISGSFAFYWPEKEL